MLLVFLHLLKNGAASARFLCEKLVLDWCAPPFGLSIIVVININIIITIRIITIIIIGITPAQEQRRLGAIPAHSFLVLD